MLINFARELSPCFKQFSDVFRNSLILPEEKIPLEEKANRVFDLTFVWTVNFFSAEKSRMGPHIKLDLECIENLFDFIQRDQYHKSWLVNLRRHDGTLFTHSLNVCLLSLSFGKYLDWSPGKIKNFGLGALLHDIGMTNIPPAITQKPDRLSDEEMELVKKHPTIGFRLLKSFAPITRDALIMVLQHHEHGIGMGYPDNLTLPKIHL